MKNTYVVSDEFRSLSLPGMVVAEITGIENRPSDEAVDQRKADAAARVLAMLEDELTASPILEGYRELVQSRGRSPKKFAPAAENLLLQVRRVGRLPTISVAVDCYNVVVIQTCLALGVHDMDLLAGPITFRFSAGGEAFRAVGSDSVKTTQAGDYVYADDQRVLAWLDAKDSDDVKLTLGSRNVLVVIQGNQRTPREYTLSALQEACETIVSHCGGAYELHAVE